MSHLTIFRLSHQSRKGRLTRLAAQTLSAISVFSVWLLHSNSLFAQPTHSPVADFKPGVMDGCLDDQLLSSGFAGCTGAAIASECKKIEKDPMQGMTGCALEALALHRSCRTLTSTATADQKRFCEQASKLDYSSTGNEAIQKSMLERMARPSGLVGVSGAAGAIAEGPVLQGMTGFFLNRAQLEVGVFIKDRIAGDLCGTNANSAAKALIPSTCEILGANGALGDAGYLLGLPAALRDDLHNLPVNLMTALYTDPAKELAPVACFVNVAASTTAALVQRSPAQAFSQLAAIKKPAYCDEPSFKALKGVFATTAEFLKAAAAKSAPITDAVVAHVIAELDGIVDAKERQWLEDHRSTFVRFSAAVSKTLGSRVTTDSVDGKELLAASAEVLSVIAQREDVLLNEKQRADMAKVADAIGLFAREQYALGTLRLFSISAIQTRIESLPEEKQDQKILKTFLRALQKHAAIVAALAEAKSGEDVQKVLETAAAPLQSWRQYRRATSGFLAGVVGIGAGLEVPFQRGANTGGFIAPVLPVGLEVGTPIGNNSTFNLFVPVIDIGALASARLDATSEGKGKDGQPMTLPNADFASVFAPGLLLGFGLGNSPFVLYGGASISPLARKYFLCADDCSTPTTVATFRLTLMIAVDVPVLPIF